MENWFIILLAALAVVAVTLLLFFALLGDDVFSMFHKKKCRVQYGNDRTDVIYRSILDAKSPRQAYLLFMEYVFINHKQYLLFVSETVNTISKSYDEVDIDALRDCLMRLSEMKLELKDQKQTQDACMDSIDPAFMVESAAWVNIATEQRFSINESLWRLTKICIQYQELYTYPIPEEYTEELRSMVQDIRNVCKSTLDLLVAGDIEGMRELRIRTAIIKSESYGKAQLLFELLHDGRSELEPERRIALSYVLNAFQECHCIVYALRRLVLCNLCLTIYSTDAVNDNVSTEQMLRHSR